jgi:AcrR family transcriptional regulator
MEPTQKKLLGISAELFAERGFSGVSMREISRSAGITQAAIYHHFTNKEALYIAAVEYLYEGQTVELVSMASQQEDPESQLAVTVSSLLELFDKQTQFRRIYFRELLDGDQKRLKLLADGVFPEIHQFLIDLMAQLAPHMDSHLMVLDLTGLIFHHLEARKLSAQLDTGRAKHQKLPYLADHIVALLLNGVRTP